MYFSKLRASESIFTFFTSMTYTGTRTNRPGLGKTNINKLFLELDTSEGLINVKRRTSY